MPRPGRPSSSYWRASVIDDSSSLGSRAGRSGWVRERAIKGDAEWVLLMPTEWTPIHAESRSEDALGSCCRGSRGLDRSVQRLTIGGIERVAWTGFEVNRDVR